MRRVAMIVLAAGFGVAGVGWAVGTSADHTGPASGISYSDQVLSRSSRMTEQMSVAGPQSGHEYHGHAGDEQLQLSANPEFLREIEAYQIQIDRMLARQR